MFWFPLGCAGPFSKTNEGGPAGARARICMGAGPPSRHRPPKPPEARISMGTGHPAGGGGTHWGAVGGGGKFPPQGGQGQGYPWILGPPSRQRPPKVPETRISMGTGGYPSGGGELTLWGPLQGRNMGPQFEIRPALRPPGSHCVGGPLVQLPRKCPPPTTNKKLQVVN